MSKLVCSRRVFCRIAAAAPAVAALRNVGAAEPAFMIHYALASSMYGKLPLAEILPEAAKCGASYIDLWPAPHGAQREQFDAIGSQRFVEQAAAQRVRLGMTTRYDLGPLGLQGEIRLLSKLGARLVVTGSVGPKNVAGAEAKAAVKRFVEQMKPHLAVAEECRVTIGIENHANALIASPDSIRYLGELSPSPRLGVALAPYHLPQEPVLLGKMIEELGPKLAHFYAWEHGRGCTKAMPKAEELEQMPGRGQLDFRPLLAALKKINYRAWTEIFMHPTPRGIPILPTAAEVTAEINRARAHLTKLLATI